jgi:hypothetical protein
VPAPTCPPFSQESGGGREEADVFTVFPQLMHAFNQPGDFAAPELASAPRFIWGHHPAAPRCARCSRATAQIPSTLLFVYTREYFCPATPGDWWIHISDDLRETRH